MTEIFGDRRGADLSTEQPVDDNRVTVSLHPVGQFQFEDLDEEGDGGGRLERGDIVRGGGTARTWVKM